MEVGPLDDITPGDSCVVYLDGKQVALFNVDGDLYALNNRCSHARGPLAEGEIACDDGVCTVLCPWHYTRFDLATGQVTDGVASAPVDTYRIDVRDGVVYVGTKPDAS